MTPPWLRIALAQLCVGVARARWLGAEAAPGGAVTSPLQIDAEGGGGSVDAFDAYIRRHGRPFLKGSTEYDARLKLFQARSKAAALHNGQPGRTWTFDASNGFADRTEEELAAWRGWQRPPQWEARGPSFLAWSAHVHEPAASQQSSEWLGRSACAMPETFSWMQLNATRRARDQGGCGSCSALAVAAMLEAHYQLHQGGDRTFAPQELISCAQNPEACGGEGGCRGGFMELLLSYAARHGCHQEADYPSTSARTQETGRCSVLPAVDQGYVDTHPGIYRTPAGAAGLDFGMVGYERLPTNEYEPVLQALTQRGPVVVALSAAGWHFYGGGILQGCPRDAVVDHAVVLLGFGKENGVKYWQIKNSWGSSWGEGGCLRLARRDDEQAWCGLDRAPELGAACSKTRGGGWKRRPLEPVEVCGTCGLLFNAVVVHMEGSTEEAKRLASLRSRCTARRSPPHVEDAVLIPQGGAPGP